MTRFLSNLHTHTVFSDGKNTPEEMVLTAINKGFESLGFSEHSPVPRGWEGLMKKENVGRYFAEVNRLKEKYAGQIDIYLGIESDALLPFDKTGLDFTIGSVHDIHDEETNNDYVVDYLPEMLEDAIRVIGKGDVKLLVKRHYEMLESMIKNYKPDIVGHPDLITKLNADNRFFDEDSAWYKHMQEDIAETIAESGLIVEVNTGAIARGYRDGPYPSAYMLSLMRELNVPVTLSSDAHSAEALDFWFDEALTLLRRIGYRSLKIMRGGVFTEIEI